MDSPSPSSSTSDAQSYASARTGPEDDALANALDSLTIIPTSHLPPSSSPTLVVKVEAAFELHTIPLKLEAPEEDSRRDMSTRREPSSDPLPSSSTTPAVALAKVSAPAHCRTAVIFQEACTGHRYTRNSDIASIVERPERIRAVKTGVASAWARLEGRMVSQGRKAWEEPAAEECELDVLMSGLGLKDKGRDKGKGREVVGGPFDILFSTAQLAADDPSLLFIHPRPNLPYDPPAPDVAPVTASTSTPRRNGPTTPVNKVKSALDHVLPASAPPKLPSQPVDPDPTLPWPLQLQHLCRTASKAILSPPYSEIPSHLPQGDLYLSEGSEAAIFGALGAVCEGVDLIVKGSRTGATDRAFVAIRPPGHHCAESAPMGFCFVNNAAVAASHAYHRHGMDRVVILDIDLHHGNGTQDIVWSLNEAAAAAAAKSAVLSGSPRKGSPKKAKRELQVMYGSLHDVFSYPCEDGDPAMVQAASLNISGGHSQFISNVHLESWTHEAEFHERLYPRYVEGLLGQAAEFCKKTTASGEDDSDRTIVILSAGFDASEHESAGMSRHLRHVPTSFFHRFARDVSAFANMYAGGRVLAVLEGGYSDRALGSATAAMMVGLTEAPRSTEKTYLVEDGKELSWWAEKNLAKVEKACKSRKTGKGGAMAVSSSSNLVLPSPRGLSVEPEVWLARTSEIFWRIEGLEGPPEKKESAASRTMQLRERRPRTASDDSTPQGSPKGKLVAPVVRQTKSAMSTPAARTEVAVGGIVAGVRGVSLDGTPTTDGAVPKIRFTFKEGGL